MGCSKSKEAVATTDNCIKKVKPSSSTKSNAIDTVPLDNDAKINDGSKTNTNDVNTNKKKSGNSPTQMIVDSNVVKENEAPGENYPRTDVNQITKIGEEIKNAYNQAPEDHHPGIVKKVNFQTGNETANANHAFEVHHPGIIKKQNIQIGNETANANQTPEVHPGIVAKENIQTVNEIANGNQALEVHPEIVEKENIQTVNEIQNGNQALEVHPGIVEKENIQTLNEIANGNHALEVHPEIVKKEDIQTGNEIANADQEPEVHQGTIEKENSLAGNEIAYVNQPQEVHHPGTIEKETTKTGNEIANVVPEVHQPETIEKEIIQTRNEIMKANQAPEDNLEMNVKESTQTGDIVKEIDNNKVENSVVIEDKKDAQVNKEIATTIRLEEETIESIISEGVSGRSDYQTPHANEEESIGNDETIKESDQELKTEPEENMVDQRNEGNVEDESEAVSSIEPQDSDIPQEQGISNGEVIIGEDF